MKKTGMLLFLSAAILLAGCPNKTPSSPNSAIVWNPWNNSVTDTPEYITSGGFYISPYPGTSLSSLVLWMNVGPTGGSYSYSVTATDGQYGGSVIGTGTTGTVSIPADSSYHPVTFAFSGNPPVTKGHVVAFTVNATSSPGGTSSFCTQSGSAGNTTIYATNGTSPPYGNPGTGGVALVVYGSS